MTVRHILTHPGSAHKDDFLACSLLVHTHGVPVIRHEPAEEDLTDPSVLVVDVGGEHDASRGNFDHHQFPRDHPPVCALSLVLQHLDLYEDALEFCDWLVPAEWLDCRGPVETALMLGIDRTALSQLLSPVDVTLLRRFSLTEKLVPEDPLWQVMSYIGEDLITYLRSLRERLNFIGEHAEFWTVDGKHGPFGALFMPRTSPLPREPSEGLGRFIEREKKAGEVTAIIYPDRRGEGYGLSRYNDNLQLDFTLLENLDDVHFAHARGFVAKTSATIPSRLKELLAAAQAPG